MPAALAIREHFLADHLRLATLLERLVAAFATNDHQKISRLWTEFDADLVAHLNAEDAHLIAALAGASERNAWVLVQEHRHIRRRLTELGAELDSHKVRVDSLRDFIDELRAHARTEDRLLYQWMEAQPDQSRRFALIDALAKRPAP